MFLSLNTILESFFQYLVSSLHIINVKINYIGKDEKTFSRGRSKGKKYFFFFLTKAVHGYGDLKLDFLDASCRNRKLSSCFAVCSS